MGKSKHSVNGRNSPGQRLGVKMFGGQVIKSGAIIVRQRGTKLSPGNNVGIGSDGTIFAKIPGIVKFEWTHGGRKCVSVYPS